MDIKLGEQVQYAIEGHSALNGAPMREGGSLTVVGNNDEVATAPGSVPIPAGGAQRIVVPVTVLATGSVDYHATYTDPEGFVFEATDTLIVTPVEPGLVRISGLFEPVPPPTP